MSISRLAKAFLLRSTRSATPRKVRLIRPHSIPVNQSRCYAPPPSHSRLYSQEAPQASKIYFFADIQKHISSPSSHPNRILIDTREPSELHSTGTIPGSINIPVTSKPDSFFITGEEFEDRFGFERPGRDKEVVFYCKAGVRSRAAAELAKRGGWQNVAEYSGSWLDWERNGGEVERV